MFIVVTTVVVSVIVTNFFISVCIFFCHFLPPKRWRKNRAVTIFGVIRENFLKRMRSHFYFVKRSPFFNANFPVCPFSEKLPAAFASDRWSDLRLFPCVSLSALRKFVDKGRRAGGGLKNDDLLMAFKSA